MRVAASVLGLSLAVLSGVVLACSSNPEEPAGSGSASGSGGEGGAGGAGGGAPAKSCDGTAAQWCGENAFCDAPPGSCPGAGVIGQCAPLPKGCGPAMQITCACNGQIYINACEANSDYADVGSQEGCKAPEAAFGCGPAVCEQGTQYCEHSNDLSACKPLPEGCKAADATCDCLEEVLCFSAPGPPMCEKKPDGTFVVTCFITE